MLGFGVDKADTILTLKELGQRRDVVKQRLDAQIAVLVAEQRRIDPDNLPGMVQSNSMLLA